MLQFVLGRASSGKTYTVTEMIRTCVLQGESPVLLLPEQFSFESEKNILEAVGDCGAQKVSVISFSRLCDEIERKNGGVCGSMMSDTDKVIIMSRAIKGVRHDLKRWANSCKSTSFAKMMVDTIGEFKLNAVTVDDLKKAVENGSVSKQLELKLRDIITIFEQYQIIINERFIDSSDRLTAIYKALENHRYFENKTVFIDGFKSFSGQQCKILERILTQAENVYITLTDNTADTNEYGTFANIKKVINRISKIANDNGVNISKPIILNTQNYKSVELCALEEFMCTGCSTYKEACNDIAICAADNAYSEADFVARSIRKIVREENANYSDFVIIARDTSPYEDAIETACRKNGIGCFIDRALPLSSQPPVVTTLAALKVAESFSTENIFHFLKSGVGILDLDQITELENYAYVWNIRGKDWEKVWDMNPDGFDVKQNKKEENEQKLKQLNMLRVRAIEHLLDFKAAFNTDARAMSKAVFNLLKNCKARKSFIDLTTNFKNENQLVYADSVKQSWGKLMNVLNSLTVCFGDEKISKAEYIEAFRNAVLLETVGVIPQNIDEVIFGSADRIRPSRPKYAFVLGANVGVFPQFTQPSGLFLSSERKKLIEELEKMDLQIPDKTVSAAIDEEHLLYSNLCCASHKVFISYTTNGSAEPSAFVEAIKKNFNCIKTSEPSFLNENNLPETAEDGFSRLCSADFDDSDTIKTMATAIESEKERVDAIQNNRTRTEFSLKPQNAEMLFGKDLYMSASKYEVFSKCPFSYFCQYGLEIEKLRPVEFNALQNGLLIHYILECAVKNDINGINKITDDQDKKQKISELVDAYTSEYLNEIPGYKSQETDYLKYLVSNIKRSACYVVRFIADEFSQSDFKTKEFELKIKEEIKIDADKKIIFTGKVDRVDKWADSQTTYVRVVDYKTGSKKFALSDVLIGQNMQMLFYLHSVCKSDNAQPAAILYLPAKRDISEKPSGCKMNGLLVDNDSIINAMEKEIKGGTTKYIPSTRKPRPSYIQGNSFNDIFKYIDSRLLESGKEIFSGNIVANPIDGKNDKACEYCDFKNVCRIENEKIPKAQKCSNIDAIEIMEGKVNGNAVSNANTTKGNND